MPCIKINPGHPIWALSSPVARYADDFLKSFRLNYFQYLRCYSDGSISLLVNRTDLFELFLGQMEYGVQSSFEKVHEKLPSYRFLWDEEIPSIPVEIARKRFGMFHGMTLVKRHKGYYDMIGFALAEPVFNPGSFYLNTIKAFENFSEEFERKRSDLFVTIEKEKLILPQPLQDKNHKEICLPEKPRKYQIQGQAGFTYLTSQEVFCLQFLNQGLSYKEISKELSISERTIETYLERAKNRTGFKNRDQILRALSSCP